MKETDTLKDLRITARKTQLEVATALGYAAISPYQRIENGNRKMIRPEMLSCLAELFAVPLEMVVKAIKNGGIQHDKPVRQVRVRPGRSAG